MAKTKFTLNPNPTFKEKVQMPVPGAGLVPVEFTFKHKTRDEFKAFLDGLADRDDLDVIMEISSGWELEEPFDREHVGQMAERYIGSTHAVVTTYMEALTKARVGN